MTSNMLAGERRWASSRRGGMTVLGKVAVPKPLNLPSQRLENHGLDPSVEIVPKGTLSWGSHPSSSGSNVWNSSSLSSNADGGNISPSHLGGRPSSGGTGTRPSTAGSDKTHEPIAGARGPNSRPSSASGTLSSNQSSSTSLRPKSAETRPNSSQLSRFAEPISESSVTWAPAERLGVKSSKEDGFSLSSGDFPTLGSEKDNSVKNFESQSDNGRPISASSRTTSPKEDDTNLADAKRGIVNSWRADGPQTVGDGIRPSMDNWQGERQQYFNANVAPQHFDSWRGSPFNGPASVWYGRPPQGPPFRTPGGFPMEPFPFYRHQVPPPALGGSQQAPPPGSGSRGPHPQHGDLYRPQMHDSYARPGAPFRPGFYAGLSGPMSYYGTPMGYCNNERDIQYMGMAAGPPVHGGYPGQSAPDIVTSRVRAGEHDISGKTMLEDMKSDHLEALGSRKAPLKNYSEWDRKGDRENWEHDVPNVLHPGNSRHPMIKSRKTEWGAENDAEEDMFANNKTPSGNYSHHSHSFPYRDHSSDSVKVKSFESIGNVKREDDSWTNKANSVATYPPGMPQLPLASGGDELLRPATNDSALMQKIEGLNAKVRASDGRNDFPNAYNTEEQRSRSQHVDLKNNNNTGPGEISNTAGFSEKAPGFGDFVPLPQEGVGDVSDKSIQPVAVVSRRSYHGGQVRVDYRGKGKFNNQDTDGWQGKLLTHDSSSAVASNIESESGIYAHGPSFVGEATDNSVTNPVGKIEGESVAETFDSTDIQAKRAKRELARQRALQLQREEEERIKEQKAKALAKLEELNRRTQAGEVANPVAGKIQAISVIQGEQEESLTIGDPVTDHPHFEAPCTTLVSEPGNAYMVRESSTSQAGKSVAQVSRNLPQDMSETGLLESDVSHGHHMPIKEDTQTVNARNAPCQRNQNNLSQQSSNAKSVPISVSARQNDSHAAAVDITGTEASSSEINPSGESNMHKTSNTVAASQRKKVNKSTKNLHKTEAAPSLPAVISDPNHEKKLSENSESKATSSNSDSSISKVIEPEGSQGHQASSLPKEDSQSGVSNHRRPQPVRRMPRSQQGNRYMDKVHGSEVVWAPVRTQIKPEDSGDASQKSTLESANPKKIDVVAQNSFKGKRAEMERYVPKPVAKELTQQGSISSSILDEAPVIGQLGSYVEIKEADGRHSKHKKEPGQWRQRGKTDSSHTRPSSIPEANKNIQQSMEQGGLEKSEKHPEIKDSHVGNTSGYNNWSNDTTPAAVSISDTRKDHGAAGRGKRHMTRRPRSSAGISADHDNIPSGQTDETSSQWKPKSRPNSANNQHGNKIAGREILTTEINKLPKNDLPQYKAPQLVFGSIVADDSIVSHHLGLNQEKKSAAPTIKERPYSPNQYPALSAWSTPTANTDSRNERNISGSGRNSQNSRFTRGYESRGERYSGQDHRMRNVPALHEKQGQNVKYEYHPVRHGKSGVTETFDGTAADGANNMDQRYRERGQSHSRRGEIQFRRQGGSVSQEY